MSTFFSLSRIIRRRKFSVMFRHVSSVIFLLFLRITILRYLNTRVSHHPLCPSGVPRGKGHVGLNLTNAAAIRLLSSGISTVSQRWLSESLIPVLHYWCGMQPHHVETNNISSYILSHKCR